MREVLDSTLFQSVLLFAFVSALSFLAKQLRSFVHEFRAAAARREAQLARMCAGLTEVKDEVVAVGAKVEQINGSMGKVRRDVDWLLGDKGRPLDMEISD